jgi:hypothetical protein
MALFDILQARMGRLIAARVGAWCLLILGVQGMGWLRAQQIIPPEHAGGIVHLFPTDLAVMEAGEARKDLPCNVVARKPELGFDLRFHIGYEATLPLAELAGKGGQLTVLFRVYPEGDKNRAAFFVQHFRVPPIEEDAKGDAELDGGVDVGEGSYHVDWLMRDHAERVCSSSWDTEAKLSDKDKIPLFLGPDQITESLREPFVNEALSRARKSSANGLNLKLLVNFAPQDEHAATLQESDTGALVSILKEIERDPRVARMSLVAFNLPQMRILYRQNAAEQIDFPALGSALKNMQLGTVAVDQLQKHSETDFLENLIEHEVAGPAHPDAIVFAGPKAMLDANVPQDDLRRIGDIECPIFYMNYNLNPQATPWKDAISHAIRVFKGTEYTISTPRDLWVATSEMLNRVMRWKHQRAAGDANARAGSGSGVEDPPTAQ